MARRVGYAMFGVLNGTEVNPDFTSGGINSTNTIFHRQTPSAVPSKHAALSLCSMYAADLCLLAMSQCPKPPYARASLPVSKWQLQVFQQYAAVVCKQ